MNKASNKPYWLPMNIQLFADGGEDTGGTDQTGENGAQGAQETAGQAKTYTEEELQSEINRAVQQRLARQKRDEEKRLEAARAEGRSEAEKLAQMTAEQRAEHERQVAEQAARDRENALAQREAEIARRELRATAIDTLSKRGLPKSLESVLDYTDADSCSASILRYLVVVLLRDLHTLMNTRSLVFVNRVNTIWYKAQRPLNLLRLDNSTDSADSGLPE